MTHIRAFITEWRARRRQLGYIPSMRELRRNRAARLAAVKRAKRERAADADAADDLQSSGAAMADYRPRHAAEYGAAIPSAALTARLRRERILRTVARGLTARHGRRRAPRSLSLHLPRLSPRQPVPVRDTARPSGALYLSQSLREAPTVEFDRAWDALLNLAERERPIRRHYARGPLTLFRLRSVWPAAIGATA